MCYTFEKSRRAHYYQNLSEENICDNKTFWKVVKPWCQSKDCTFWRNQNFKKWHLFWFNFWKSEWWYFSNSFPISIENIITGPSVFYQIFLKCIKEVLLRKNNNKVDSIETGRIAIADLLPWSDLEKYLYITLFDTMMMESSQLNL